MSMTLIRTQQKGGVFQYPDHYPNVCTIGRHVNSIAYPVSRMETSLCNLWRRREWPLLFPKCGDSFLQGGACYM